MVFKIKSIFGAKGDQDQEPGTDNNNPEQDSHEDSHSVDVPLEDPAPASEIVPLEAPNEIEGSGTLLREPQSDEPSVESDASEESDAVPAKKYNSPSKRKPKNQEELFFETIPDRANFASEHLKQILNGSILFDILPSGKKFLINWVPNQGCAVSEYDSQKSDSQEKPAAVNCTISIHGRDLMRIVDGDLNPQVLMLSHKAKVTGSAALATYIFNLIAPNSNL